MATLGRTADRFPEKLKCQTFEWKTDLCRHHVDQPPPLMLPTIPVHYYCVLPIKELERIAFVDDLIIKAHVAGSLVAALVEEPKGSHPVLWQQVTQW